MVALAYLAGPEVFLPDAKRIGEAKKRICRDHGFEGVFPLDADLDIAELDVAAIGHLVFERCIEHMDRCELVIANMTPFRGPSMDVGTAVEIGYMLAAGKPVFGYTNTTADYARRVAPDGLMVEELGFSDNLMCEGAVWRSGGRVVRVDTPAGEMLTSLAGFEQCVREAAKLYAPGQRSP